MIFRLCRSSSTLAVLPFTKIFISQITIKFFFNKFKFLFFSIAYYAIHVVIRPELKKTYSHAHIGKYARTNQRHVHTHTHTNTHAHAHAHARTYARTHAHTTTITTTSTKLKMNFIICNILVFCFCYAYFGKKSLTKVRSSDVSF